LPGFRLFAGGFVMSLEGGFEELPEFFFAAASWASTCASFSRHSADSRCNATIVAACSPQREHPCSVESARMVGNYPVHPFPPTPIP